MDAFLQHIETYFIGHVITTRKWRIGPILKVLPNFNIIEIQPGPKTDLWTYVSYGAREIKNEDGAMLEFLEVAQEQNAGLALSLAMTVYYHSHPDHRLGFGHTFPIGESWLEGSACNYILVTHQYLFDPDLEIWQDGDRHGHLFWLVPITQAERDFKVKYGLEELEERFEQAQPEFWLPNRLSVI